MAQAQDGAPNSSTDATPGPDTSRMPAAPGGGAEDEDVLFDEEELEEEEEPIGLPPEPRPVEAILRDMGVKPFVPSGAVLDMDGTTLNSQGKLTPRTIHALRRAENAGIALIIATGRPALSLQPFVDELSLNKPLTCVVFNGAAVAELAPHQTPRILKSSPLTLEAAMVAVACVEEMGFAPSLCAPTITYASPSTDEQEALLRDFERLGGVRHKRCSTVRPYLEGALKVIAPCGEAGAAGYAETARRRVHNVARVIPAEMHVEFVDPGVSKGAALCALSQAGHEDIVAAGGLQNFLAVGDNFNDVDMLQAVGLGVAMANAKPVVKDIATRVLPFTNDEDGVAQELETLVAATEAKRMWKEAKGKRTNGAPTTTTTAPTPSNGAAATSDGQPGTTSNGAATAAASSE